jgi:hypothetical protein
MKGSNARITTVDRIAVTATFAATVLILAVLGLAAKAETQSFSEVAPFAVPPTVCMPKLETGHPAPIVSLTGRRY